MFCVRRKILLQVELLRLFTGRFKPILFNCGFSSQRVEFPGDWRERSMAFLHSASYSCSKGHLHLPPKSRTWVEVPPAYSRDKMLTGGYLNKSSLILFFLVQAPYLPSLNTCCGKFISLQVPLEAVIQFFSLLSPNCSNTLDPSRPCLSCSIQNILSFVFRMPIPFQLIQLTLFLTLLRLLEIYKREA